MATIVNFNGKNHIEPGAYAASVYNPTSVSNLAEFGNVMLIDTGLSINGSYEFAGGSGINGELKKGLKSVYEFDNYEDFLEFSGGGLVGDIAKKIFTPVQGAIGAPKLYYVRAAKTTAASIVLTLSEGNSITLKCKNEGITGNGVETDSLLRVGYSAEIIAGVESNTFKLRVKKGTFRGVDKDGEPFGNYPIGDSKPETVVESQDFTTLIELYNWAISNKVLLSHFEITKSGVDSTPLILISKTLSSGGTTLFLDDTEYSDVLEAIEELDITFFLCSNLNSDNGKGVDVSTNSKLFTFLKTIAKFDEFMVVPGGESDDDLFGDSNSSESIAKFYNSSRVVCVHGSPTVIRKDRNGTKDLNSIYLAATIIGLNAGNAAQTPLTFKRVGYQNFSYDLKKIEREKALQAGIMHVRNVNGYWCVNQGINTLLDNKKTISNDGQSFELSIELIKAQLNKELILESQERFIGQTAAQASPESVKNFTETKLASLVAYPGNDNLIISWQNVKVLVKNSDYHITFDFVPNVPVNKTFFVSNILDFSIEV